MKGKELSVCVCVCVRVYACVRVCVCVCTRVCLRMYSDKPRLRLLGRRLLPSLRHARDQLCVSQPVVVPAMATVYAMGIQVRGDTHHTHTPNQPPTNPTSRRTLPPYQPALP
jgi:hypothetical protein